ncbi:hypothetical protein [Aliiruegeria lutimaris]|uniref:Uncharacterized protein n=1 Tax=Aliiruegeria lutimaris TaxID=571298 RepID=A0A1G8LRE1_9RHOB|nr:hypothetical protein [Aliiruegeria lutimaris]SDI58185.1 hypothetical protein SAMN04488026_1004121 [Aliiruegeria lutimaris]
MEEENDTPLQKLRRTLRLAIIVLVGVVLALTILFTVFGTWKGMSSREELLDANGIHVLPHLLRNTYTGDARFDVACDAPESCTAAAREICGDTVVVLSEPQKEDGIWIMVAECEPGTEPQW